LGDIKSLAITCNAVLNVSAANTGISVRVLDTATQQAQYEALLVRIGQRMPPAKANTAGANLAKLRASGACLEERVRRS
jgi:hypothetical protein